LEALKNVRVMADDDVRAHVDRAMGGALDVHRLHLEELEAAMELHDDDLTSLGAQPGDVIIDPRVVEWICAAMTAARNPVLELGVDIDRRGPESIDLPCCQGRILDRREEAPELPDAPKSHWDCDSDARVSERPHFILPRLGGSERRWYGGAVE